MRRALRTNAMIFSIVFCALSGCHPGASAGESAQTKTLPSKAKLAEEDWLVTVVPPKTQHPLIDSLAPDQFSVVLYGNWTAPKLSAALAMAKQGQLKPVMAFSGAQALEMPSIIRQASNQSTLAGRGFEATAMAKLTRDQLDEEFKASNRALFDACGQRPRLFLSPDAIPSQDEVDYAAINGMRTLVQTANAGTLLFQSVDEADWDKKLAKRIDQAKASHAKAVVLEFSH